jgi:hypothetical protein
MPHRISRRRLAGLVILAAAAAVLAGCGGSSKSSTNAAATTTTGQGAARFAALRSCLAKNGISLPQRTPGQGRPPGAGRGAGGIFGGGGGPGAGGPRLPAGVTTAQYQAALAKCGGSLGARRQLTPAQKAAQQAALVKFATCMRADGVPLAAPNATGTGPVFNTSKIDTKSAKFTAAETKCAPLLPARFGRRGGGPPAAGGTTTTS